VTEKDIETVRVRALRNNLTGTMLYFRQSPSLLPGRPAEVFNPQLQEGALCWVGLRMVALSIIAALLAAIAN
jgi:hypothetical protein